MLFSLQVEFSQNRELWKRRASSHTQLSGGALSLSKEGDVWSESGLSKESSQWTEGLRHSKDTPDLVMDLPDLSQKTRLSECCYLYVPYIIFLNYNSPQ